MQHRHDEHHRDRADHADRGGVALPPEAGLERLVVHEDRPGVGRRGAVEAAEDQIFVDHRHRRAEAQHDQDHHDRRELRPRHMPEHLPLVRAVDARGVRQVLGDRGQAREEEDRVVAEAPPHFHDRDRGQRERRAAEPLRRVLQREQAERVDQQMIDRAALVIVHPLPQHEDQRARNDRGDEQDHAVDRGEAVACRPGRRGSRAAAAG